MAKKIQMETPEQIEEVTLDQEQDPKAVTIKTALESSAVGTKESDIGLDLSTADQEDPFGGLSDEPGLNDWVVARFDGTPGTSKGEHKQSVNGVKAIFPLGQHRLTQYYFIKGARRSGNADFASNPGRKNMRAVDNRPVFFVQKIEDQYQDNILEYVQKVQQERNVILQFAADQL